VRSSFCWENRSQIINLLSVGYNVSYLDTAPILLISADGLSFGPAADSWQVDVQLLDDENDVITRYHECK
jgi:hypothetical protein